MKENMRVVMKKVQKLSMKATVIGKKYSPMIVTFIAMVAIKLLKLTRDGLSIVLNRLTPLNKEESGDEITSKNTDTESKLHDSGVNKCKGVEDREESYIREPISPVFPRAYFVPNSIPNVIYDNKEQVRRHVKERVAELERVDS